MPLSLIIFLTLRFALSEINIAIPAFFWLLLAWYMTSPVAQMVKHLSTMRETQVPSLGREVPSRRKRQPTPVLLPRKYHGQRSLVSMGSQRVRHNWAASLHFTSAWYIFPILFIIVYVIIFSEFPADDIRLDPVYWSILTVFTFWFMHLDHRNVKWLLICLD